jgi:hypothetical protein
LAIQYQRPAISWAIVDYFGRPKLAYRRLVDWYNPILVCLTFPLGRRWQAGEPFAAEIWVINDTLQPMPNCHLVIQLDHQPIHSQTLTLSAHSAGLVGLLNHQLTTAPQQLDLSLYQQEQLIAQNQYDLTWQDLTRSSLAGRWRRWIADWVMR